MVYRDLVWGGVQDTLSGAYPIAEHLLGADRWKALIERFFAEHPVPSPELWRMPLSLYDFVRETRYGPEHGLPFLEQLILFEWKEIELHMALDPELPPYQEAKELTLDDPPLVNPVMEILPLSYPVFRSRDLEEIAEEGNYFLLLFRHPEHLDVRFIELSPLYAAVLGVIMSAGGTFRGSLEAVADLSKISVTEAHLEQTKLFVQALLQQQVILGSLIEGASDETSRSTLS